MCMSFELNNNYHVHLQASNAVDGKERESRGTVKEITLAAKKTRKQKLGQFCPRSPKIRQCVFVYLRGGYMHIVYRLLQSVHIF